MKKQWRRQHVECPTKNNIIKLTMFLAQRLSNISLNKRHLLGISRNLSQQLDHYNPLLDYTPSLSERTILLVGDGDLSNGAAMTEIINNARPDVKIVASVLESEVMHNNGKICMWNKSCFYQ